MLRAQHSLLFNAVVAQKLSHRGCHAAVMLIVAALQGMVGKSLLLRGSLGLAAGEWTYSDNRQAAGELSGLE